MSMRYSRLASRSFIIGSRLWPPATSRASLAQPLEEADGVVDAGGAFVVERCGYLHAGLRVSLDVRVITRLSRRPAVPSTAT